MSSRSPPQQSSPTDATQTPSPPHPNPSYIHNFGYHFAKRLVGSSSIDGSIWRDRGDQLGRLGQHDQCAQCLPNGGKVRESNDGNDNPPPTFVRAYWRSEVNFPWEASTNDFREDAFAHGSVGGIGNIDIGNIGSGIGNIGDIGSGIPPMKSKISTNVEISQRLLPQTLFVDVTFDLCFVPRQETEKEPFSNFHEKNDKHNPLRSFHPIGSGEGEEGGEDETPTPTRQILAVAVAIRVGALLSMPSNATNTNESNESKESGTSNRNEANEMKNDQNDNNDENDDNPRFYYLQSQPLTAADIFDHCRSVDVDPEMTNASNVADLIADSLMGTSSSGMIPWQMIGQLETSETIETSQTSRTSKTIGAPSILVTDKFTFNGSNHPPTTTTTTTTTNTKGQWQWYLIIKHESLNEEGMLHIPVHSNDGNGEKVNLFGEPLSENIMYSMLLQGDSRGSGGRCIPLPMRDARSFWNEFPLVKEVLDKISSTGSIGSTGSTGSTGGVPCKTNDADASKVSHSSNISTAPYNAGRNGATERFPTNASNIANNANTQLSSDCAANATNARNTMSSTTTANATNAANTTNTTNATSTTNKTNNRATTAGNTRPYGGTAMFARETKTSIVGRKRKKKKFTLGSI